MLYHSNIVVNSIVYQHFNTALIYLVPTFGVSFNQQ